MILGAVCMICTAVIFFVLGYLAWDIVLWEFPWPWRAEVRAEISAGFRQRVVTFSDWMFSYDYGVEGRRSLPEWPRWLCRAVTGHEVCLKWADYLNDVSGERCRCGLKHGRAHGYVPGSCSSKWWLSDDINVEDK